MQHPRAYVRRAWTCAVPDSVDSVVAWHGANREPFAATVREAGGPVRRAIGSTGT